MAFLAALALAPGSALAHSELVSSSPKSGARLATAPKAVVLNFSEPLRRVLQVRVRDARGRNRVSSVRLDSRGKHRVRAALSRLSRGRYTVAWVVVAADGFTQGGTFAFRVTAAGRP